MTAADLFMVIGQKEAELISLRQDYRLALEENKQLKAKLEKPKKKAKADEDDE